MATLVVLLQAQAALVLQPPVTHVEYPIPSKEGARGEGPSAWLCLNKAAWVAERVLGVRPSDIRDRFVDLLRLNATQVLKHPQTSFHTCISG